MQGLWNYNGCRGAGRNNQREVTGNALKVGVGNLLVFEIMGANWEHFPHQADIGVRGIGLTKEAAFEGPRLALTAVITEPESVVATQSVSIACVAPDDELLLVDWLNALVYEMVTRKMLFGRYGMAKTPLEGNRKVPNG